MSKLDSFLRKYSKNGYPIITNSIYENLVSSYKKEDIIDVISDILMEDKNKKIPFSFCDEKEVEDLFLSLCDKKEEIIKDSNNKIWTKHLYDFNMKDYFGTIQLGHHYNNISNYFQKEDRYRCGGYNRVSPHQIWNGHDLSDKEWKKKLKGFLSPLFRSVNNFRKIEEPEYMFCFRLSSTVYTAPQFRPNVAKIIYEKFSKNGKVIDFSMGWGDRLAGFFASENTKCYVGVDPNLDLHKNYDRQVEFYSKHKTKEVHISKDPAEDFDWSRHRNFDLIFTSPPYFSTERYAKYTDFESNQSWFRYKNNKDWLENFLFKTLEKTIDCLSNKGILAINIFDVELSKNKREFICEPLINFCEKIGYNYLGYVGMRMKQRPKNFKNDLEKKEFMSSYYVEPIWIFEKK
jgi:hypothetical protein